MGAAFHARVRTGFREIADREPRRCVLIDANRSEPVIHDAILAAVSQAFA